MLYISILKEPFPFLSMMFQFESRCVWQVVSREGMLGSAESLSRLPQSRAVTYLKVNKRISWQTKIEVNKKVLLRDHKRRTTRGVASLVLLSIGSSSGWGAPPPPRRTWHRTFDRTSDRTGSDWWVPPERTWDQRLERHLGPEAGVPPPQIGPTDRKTDACENITFPPYYVRHR